MRTPNRNRFLRPEQFMSELLKKSMQGDLREKGESIPFLMRALVIAVDVEGGKLENKSGTGTLSHKVGNRAFDVKARHGPDNPKNSIKAQIISDGFDKFFENDEFRVFWPFFPEHLCSPIKPGEHVYIVFEDSHYEHGLWITKIPGHEGTNYVPGQDEFKSSNSDSIVKKFPETVSLSSGKEEFVKDTDAAESGATHDIRKKFS